MTPRVRECQAKQGIMWRFGEGAQLTTIGEEIVQRQHRSRGSFTTRLVAQAVVAARRESRNSRSSGRLWRKEPRSRITETPAHPQAATSRRLAGETPCGPMRSHATSQTAPTTRPPHTAVAVSTGKR